MNTEMPLDTVGMTTADWCQDADDWEDEDDYIASVAITTATEPVTMATDDMDIMTSSDREAEKQSNSLDDDSAIKLVGSYVSRSGTSDLMAVTPGGENTTEFGSTELRLQCMQLEERGNGCTERGDSNGVVDKVSRLVDNRLVAPQLVPGTLTGASDSDWHDGDVTLSHPECEFVSRYVTVIEEPEKERMQLKHERHLLAEYGSKEGVDLDALSGLNHG